MIIIKFPKFDVDNIEVLITEKFSIFVDLRFIFDIEQTLQDIGFLKLPKSYHIYLNVIL